MQQKQADVVVRMLEAGHDGRWPFVRDRILEAGYVPEEIIEATNALYDEAGLATPVLGPEDFQ